MRRESDNIRLIRAGLPEEALDAATEAVRSCRLRAIERPAKYEPALAAALDELSAVLYELGRPVDAVAALRESVALLRPYRERALGMTPLGIPIGPASAPQQKKPAKAGVNAAELGVVILEKRPRWLGSALTPTTLGARFFYELAISYWHEARIAVFGTPGEARPLTKRYASAQQVTQYPAVSWGGPLSPRLFAVRTLHMANSVFNVTVSAGERARDLLARTAPPSPGLRVHLGGSPITIVISAPGLIRRIGKSMDIQAPATGGSESAEFTLRPQDAGTYRVENHPFHGGSQPAEVTLEVSVHGIGFDEQTLAWSSPVSLVHGRGGEVILVICRRDEHYEFWLDAPGNYILLGPVPGRRPPGDPAKTAERTIRRMSGMAAGTIWATEEVTVEAMRAAGISLWREMVPQEIKDIFWQLCGITAITIQADDDTVPWELLYPISKGRPDRGFLIQQFPVLRRISGRIMARITVGDPRYIVPPFGAPANAMVEVDAIRGILGHGAAENQVIRRVQDLLEVIRSGGMGMAHFACHNTFTPGGGGSQIDMADGPFTPDMLDEAVETKCLAGCGLVFINACRTDSPEPQYTEMVGWAQQFMKAGAGAFVGTLWAIRTGSAQKFAEVFYRALNSGLSLGEAAKAARLASRENDPADPTWLAYTVYGAPSATAVGFSPEEK